MSAAEVILEQVELELKPVPLLSKPLKPNLMC